MEQSKNAIKYLENRFSSGCYSFDKNMILDLLTGFERNLNEGKSAAKVELEQAVEVFALLKHKNIIRVFQEVMQHRGFKIPKSEFEQMFRLKDLPPVEIAMQSVYLPINRELETIQFDCKITKDELLSPQINPIDALNRFLKKACQVLVNDLLDKKAIDLKLDSNYEFIRVTGKMCYFPPLDVESMISDKNLNELLNDIKT